MLDYIGELSLGERIREAITKTLANPEQRTGDLGGKLGTKAFTQCVIGNLS
jgi:isocitrate dehydrogenase (NAD+)